MAEGIKCIENVLGVGGWEHLKNILTYIDMGDYSIESMVKHFLFSL